MLPEVNMIHMNGRVYEPSLGRFMSADPQVQFAGFSQSYNRYSYTLNNPLSYFDPTGYGTWSRFRDKVLNPFSSTSPINISNPNSIFNPAGRNSIWWGARENFFGARSGNLGQILMGRAHMFVPGLYSIDEFNSQNPSAARIATTVGTVACGFTTVFYAVCAAGVSAYSTAVMGGGNSDIVKSAAIAYLVADASSAVSSSGWSAPVKVFANGVIGGIASDLQGGSFRQGFIYSAASSGANELYKGLVGYEIDPQSGGDAVTKNLKSPPVEGANNVGFQGEKLIDGLPCGFCEGGTYSRILNRVPLVNAIAGLHDVFQINLGSMRGILNFPGMPVAAFVVSAGMLNGPASLQLTIQYEDNDND